MIVITTRKKDNCMGEALVKNTYQDAFPEIVKCYRCDHSAIPILLIDDNEGVIRLQRPDNVKIWPHDAMSAVSYLCTECGEMSMLWNQA